MKKTLLLIALSILPVHTGYGMDNKRLVPVSPVNNQSNNNNQLNLQNTAQETVFYILEKTKNGYTTRSIDNQIYSSKIRKIFLCITGECEENPQTFTSYNGLKSHNAAHHENQECTCFICSDEKGDSKIYASEKFLRDHYRNAHPDYFNSIKDTSMARTGTGPKRKSPDSDNNNVSNNNNAQ